MRHKNTRIHLYCSWPATFTYIGENLVQLLVHTRQQQALLKVCADLCLTSPPSRPQNNPQQHSRAASSSTAASISTRFLMLNGSTRTVLLFAVH